jgi:hypothetical protein
MSTISLYKVLTMVERMDIAADGTFTRLMEIQAETKSGVKFKVLMKREGFTKDAAAKALEKEAREIEDTLALRR